jgi:hemerythrin-like metal-binding protein
MAPLKWKPEYSVGDPAVDQEHQELIDLVNTAASAILDGRPGADIERSLGDVLLAISAHFAHEETQMRRAHYDQLTEHKTDHERLLDELRDIMDQTGGYQASTADRLVAILESWFTDHSRIHDSRLHNRLGPHEH